MILLFRFDFAKNNPTHASNLRIGTDVRKYYYASHVQACRSELLA